MILVSDDDSFKDSLNSEDKLGERVEITTIIIKKKDGDIIKDYFRQNPNNDVSMSVKFNSIIEGDKFDFQLFLRSDDIKALNFFREFRVYYEKLSIFIVVYYKRGRLILFLITNTTSACFAILTILLTKHLRTHVLNLLISVDIQIKVSLIIKKN